MASLFANNAETRAQIEQRPGHMSSTGDWIPDDERDICSHCFKQIKMGIFVGLICSLILTLTAIEHVLTFHSLIQSSFLSLSSFVVVIFIVVIFFLVIFIVFLLFFIVIFFYRLLDHTKINTALTQPTVSFGRHLVNTIVVVVVK